MGSSRFVPLVIAGFIGLLVGWLLGPDVDDVEEALGDRLTQIEAKVDAVQAPVTALQTGFKGVDERITQIATQVQAVGTPTEAVTALSAKLDEANAAAKTATDALAQKLDAIAAAPAPAAPAAPAGGDFAALASGLGNSGAILLAGQSAIFGSKTLTVSAVSAGGASLAPEGGAPNEVVSGASVDLGGGCSVTLKGVAGPAALLSPAGCGAPSASAAPAESAATPAAPAPAAPAPAVAAPADTPAAPAAAASAAPSGALVIGQTAVFGEKKAFLSRIDAAAQTAFFFVPGKGQVPAKAGAALDLGDGCSLTVGSVEATSVSLQPAGCGEAPAGASAAAPAAAQAAETAQAPAPTAPAPAEPAAPAEQPAAAPAPAASAAAPAGAAGAASTIGIGQTASFGEKRIFLSRLTPEAAFIVVVGAGPQEVKPGASADLGGGCSAKLDKIEATTASFTPAGC